ncbi:uncharacterized protein IUM83_00011 [Phytophthora cinnamomi]|uniref:uncharacterized protein n=1 Tax=Phytophthora cinnamomi TaxID=4785 RepID=UPI003559F6F7|nr:hypothetical protein IUM83_00011 [Phytophthora cinnamomi]
MPKGPGGTRILTVRRLHSPALSRSNWNLAALLNSSWGSICHRIESCHASYIVMAAIEYNTQWSRSVP